PNKMQNGGDKAHGQYILWNFYNGQGKTLKFIGSRTIVGSILAPGIKIDKREGYVEGQIVADSFYMEGGEVHFQLYKSTVTPPNECTGCESKNLVFNPDFSASNATQGWEVQKSRSDVSWGVFDHNF